MKLSSLFLCTIFYASVFASLSVSDIPSCALKCSIQILSAANCSLLDPAPCVCTDVPLQSTISTCVQQNCTYKEQLVAASYQSQICETYPPLPSKSNYIRTIAIVMLFVTLPFLVGRTLSRWLVIREMGSDDWVIVAATACFLATAGLEITAATKGFGSHYWTINPSHGPSLLKIFFALLFFYLIIQNLAKISILLFYLRIFPSQPFRLTCYLVIIFVALCGLAFCFVALFECTPIKFSWDKSIEGKCIDVSAVTYAISAVSILEDLVILIMPIPQLWSLKVNKGRRLGLIIMFSVGSFACITSIIRIHYISQYTTTSYDITYDNVSILIWSGIETNVALICVSLPSLKPLILKIIPKVYRDYLAKGLTEPSWSKSRKGKWYGWAKEDRSGVGMEALASRGSEKTGGGIEVQKGVVTELSSWEEVGSGEMGILTKVTVAEKRLGNRMSWVKGGVKNLSSKGAEDHVGLHFEEDAEMELVEKQSGSGIANPKLKVQGAASGDLSEESESS